MTIFELVNCGRMHVDLFLTIDGAKAEAQRILDGYVKLYKQEAAKGDDEAIEGAEELTAPDGTLTWEMEQHYLGGPKRPDPRFPFNGGPVLTSHYSESSYFTILKRRVRP